MVVARSLKGAAGSRVARYRERQARSGLRRVEVAVPVEDVALIRSLASALRSGGGAAERLRATVGEANGFAPARTGDELRRFLP